jgi:hypothetical protein
MSDGAIGFLLACVVCAMMSVCSYLSGNDIGIERMQREAVLHGAAEYRVTVDKSKTRTEFHWLTKAKESK